MKFTKEQLEEKLTAGLSNNGTKNSAMSKRSIGDFAKVSFERLAKQSNAEELELEDVSKELLPVLEIFDGNVRKDNSDFIKQWKAEHPEPDDHGNGGAGDHGNGGGNKGGDDSKLDQIMQQLNAMKAELETEKAAKTVAEKRNLLKSSLKSKNVKSDEWIESQLELIHIDKETDVESLTEKLVNAYNKFGAHTPEDITPGATGGGSKEPDFDDVVALVKKQSHRE